VDLRVELIQSLQAYAEGHGDARTAYLSLTRLGPAIDASGDGQLLDLWEQAFTLLSELNHGDDADTATRAELRKFLAASIDSPERRATTLQAHPEGR
jgi:hypothetical protein